VSYRLELDTAPTAEPVSTAEAKEHLRVLDDADDSYIGTLVTAVRRKFEELANVSLLEQDWILHLDGFPADSDVIELPRGPLQSVSSITYLDTAGDSQTMDADDYVVDTSGRLGRIGLEWDASWPTTKNVIDAVQIAYTAGYGEAADVPELMCQAILLGVSHYYEQREPVVTGTIVTAVPGTWDALLEMHRERRF
jgi:uncharacterized phiE125 gp8 family phage protein